MTVTRISTVVFFLVTMYMVPHVKPNLDRLPRTPVIHTKYGQVQGRVLMQEGVAGLQPVHVFKGIPYATPPIGPNRYIIYF